MTLYQKILSVFGLLRTLIGQRVAREEIASTFSASQTYAIGRLVVYENVLYRCTTQHTGAWNAEHFSRITIDGALILKADLVGGKVPSSQMTSYILEYASRSSFPATGESGKLYIAKDTNVQYRWENMYIPVGGGGGGGSVVPPSPDADPYSAAQAKTARHVTDDGCYKEIFSRWVWSSNDSNCPASWLEASNAPDAQQPSYDTLVKMWNVPEFGIISSGPVTGNDGENSTVLAIEHGLVLATGVSFTARATRSVSGVTPDASHRLARRATTAASAIAKFDANGNLVTAAATDISKIADADGNVIAADRTVKKVETYGDWTPSHTPIPDNPVPGVTYYSNPSYAGSYPGGYAWRADQYTWSQPGPGMPYEWVKDPAVYFNFTEYPTHDATELTFPDGMKTYRKRTFEDKLALESQLDGKVDVIPGKGLSSNDYTNEDKADVEKVKDKADEFTEWVTTGIPDGVTVTSGPKWSEGNHQWEMSTSDGYSWYGPIEGEDAVQIVWYTEAPPYVPVSTRKRVLRTGDLESMISADNETFAAAVRAVMNASN